MENRSQVLIGPLGFGTLDFHEGANVKRAWVFVGWGNRGCEDLVRAIARLPNAAREGIDVIAITDRELDARGLCFDHVRASFSVPGNLRKSEALHSWLPRTHDTYCYLDNDVTIVGTQFLRLFEAAETYGLALAHAPRYSLSDLTGFEAILLQEGIGQKSQAQFNSGVYGFSRSSGRRVNERWFELSRKYSGSWHSDQALLSLTLELEQVLPYVLTKNFNLRGEFDVVFGAVQMWHSDFPPQGRAYSRATGILVGPDLPVAALSPLSG